MADFPSNLWLRDPVIGGRRIKGGELNRAVALLAQARAEVAAVETALGTDVAGSAIDLVTRLALRHSQSGIPRGRVWNARSVTGWFTRKSTNLQFGLSPVQSTANPTISFTTSYNFTNPDFVVVNYVAHETDKLLGAVQWDRNFLTSSQFRVFAQNFSSGGVFGNPSGTARYYVVWCAVGGT